MPGSFVICSGVAIWTGQNINFWFPVIYHWHPYSMERFGLFFVVVVVFFLLLLLLIVLRIFCWQLAAAERFLLFNGLQQHPTTVIRNINENKRKYTAFGISLRVSCGALPLFHKSFIVGRRSCVALFNWNFTWIFRYHHFSLYPVAIRWMVVVRREIVWPEIGFVSDFHLTLQRSVRLWVRVMK